MERTCCYIDAKTDRPCEAKAEWEIRHGDGPDDYTDGCTGHVGALLTDATVHTIYPIK